MTFRILPALAASAALIAAGSVFAHAALVSSTPAAAAVVAKPSKIALTFNEKIIGAASGADLNMTSMPGAYDQIYPTRPLTATPGMRFWHRRAQRPAAGGGCNVLFL